MKQSFTGIKVFNAYSFPCGMGLSVLGGPINQLLFGDSKERQQL